MPAIRCSMLAMLAPALLAAQEGRAGHTTFQIPAGWQLSEGPGGTTLTPPGVPSGMVVIFLGERALTTSFREGFDADVRALGQGFRAISTEPVKPARSMQGLEMLSTQTQLQGANGTRSYRFYLAANPPGRLAMTVYMTATPQLYSAHWNTILQFAASLRYDSVVATSPGPATAGAQPLPGAAPAAAPPAAAPSPVVVPPGRLEGIYAGYKYVYVTVLGAVQKQAREDQYTFFADGTVYWGLVPMLGFDMAAARRKDPEYAGTYTMTGNRVTVSLGGGNRFVAVLSGRTLQIEDRPYSLQGDPARPAGRMLTGLFRREDAQPGEELARRFIRFTADGRFEDQGIVESILATEIVNGEPVPERPAGQGTYRLARNTLVLRYADGYERRLPITVEPSEEPRPVLTKLSVNGYSLVASR